MISERFLIHSSGSEWKVDTSGDQMYSILQ